MVLRRVSMRSQTQLSGRVMACAAAGLLGLGGVAHGQPLHSGDVALDVQDGRIVTGDIIDGAPSFPHYVFSNRFGGDGIPNFTADPGFDSPTGTFSQGTVLGLRVRRALRVWDEVEEHFETIPEERLKLTRFSTEIFTPEEDPSSGDPLPSLELGQAGTNGKIHVHPWYELMPPAGTGVYLLELELWSTGPETSEPFWIVFNQNAPQGVFNDARDWARANLPPSGECIADWNGDGEVDINDFFAYLADFEAGEPRADLNNDGEIDINDFFIFLQEFEAGC